MFEIDSDHQEIALRLAIALAIGALIGLERSYHGRPAGFRTHALVCLSTCLLMLITVFEGRWFPTGVDARITLDPTRMAQGIMTGIGFLGAGAIMKDGLSVRGLTTAADINDAVMQLRDRLGEHFELIRSVSFAQVGDP